MLGKYIYLKFYFFGIFAADNFPKLTRERFIIVNASPAQYEGSHWIIILFLENRVYLADPLGISIQNYQIVYSRLIKFYNEITQVLKLKPVQNQKLKTLWTFLHLYCACDSWLRISFIVEYER